MKQIRWSQIQNMVSDPSIGYSMLRIYLGLGLLVRGAMFISKPEVLLDYLKTSNQWVIPLVVSHYVAAAHLCGGILLALGLGTRIAAVLQVPALFGAVFFVHAGEGLLSAGQSLEFSGLVLAMLLVYSAFGGGKWSLDGMLEQPPDTEHEPEPAPTRQPEASRVHLS